MLQNDIFMWDYNVVLYWNQGTVPNRCPWLLYRIIYTGRTSITKMYFIKSEEMQSMEFKFISV